MGDKANQCANCGQPAVEGIKLCENCLKAWAIGIKDGREKTIKEDGVKAASAAVVIFDKNKEIKELKYQLKLHKKIISHIFREYQIVKGLKAVDILA